ncbi:hypothetical protein AVEN_239403-1 [Araneus ventricosus]|uniref:Uncharacterized protein n=1 Tax=Araneus ventricosus TaxID=182803 RepID=A0A4Y2SRV8_ARAVE|nr:hypothetical protein AVEN_239403-1 [Araneus ventricosus]
MRRNATASTTTSASTTTQTAAENTAPPNTTMRCRKHHYRPKPHTTPVEESPAAKFTAAPCLFAAILINSIRHARRASARQAARRPAPSPTARHDAAIQRAIFTARPHAGETTFTTNHGNTTRKRHEKVTGATRHAKSKPKPQPPRGTTHQHIVCRYPPRA